MTQRLEAAARHARRLLGWGVGLLAYAWLRTLRVTLSVDPALDRGDRRPWVLAFFHGTQWPLLAWRRRRPTAVLVSLSRDGDIQAGALSALGFSVVRGSSSRGGARGLASLVRALARGSHDAAFAVDGPRGPYGAPKPGAALAARRVGALVVPMGSAIMSGKVFERAWDRFALAWPFSRVAIVLGRPVALTGEASDAGALAAAIASANDAAKALLSAPRGAMVRSAR